MMTMPKPEMKISDIHAEGLVYYFTRKRIYAGRILFADFSKLIKDIEKLANEIFGPVRFNILSTFDNPQPEAGIMQVTDTNGNELLNIRYSVRAYMVGWEKPTSEVTTAVSIVGPGETPTILNDGYMQSPFYGLWIPHETEKFMAYVRQGLEAAVAKQ